MTAETPERPLPSSPRPPALPQPTPQPAPAATLDPTRYRDWEKGGRCIDF